MERLLISGIDGVVGANLALALRDRFEVIGLYHASPVELPGCRTLPCGENGSELSAAARGEAPDWMIHCGPLAATAWDVIPVARLDEQPGIVGALAEGMAHVGSLLTCITSDAVFAGPALFHDEHAIRGGVGALAEACRQSEDLLANHAVQSLTVRTHAYGWSVAPSSACLAERCWQAALDASPLALDADAHATPILATDLAELLAVAWQRRLRGVCHLAGAERASPARLAAALSQHHDQHSPTFALATAAPSAGLARETSLGTRRGRRELAMPMPLLREGLARFAEQAANGHRDQLRSAVTGLPCGAAA
jgi:dTDP-4-dehydrorhamnose reductase